MLLSRHLPLSIAENLDNAATLAAGTSVTLWSRAEAHKKSCVFGQDYDETYMTKQHC
jgi:hypothetical protein